MNLNDIQKTTKAELNSEEKETNIIELLIDSRKIVNPSKALFIAIKGGHRDGHQFLEDAYKKGVRNFLISEEQDPKKYPGAALIKVTDTVLALQQIAASYRNQFHFPVIGITGSNGKTIVKEWLFQLLSDDYKIARSPKSYNSQIGVPLSVWRIQPQHNLGIFEAGISQPGEMSRSEKILHPEIGIFTNIGEAHSEGFMNMRQKINEKLVLFRHSKELIYCKDHHELHECIVQYCHQVRSQDDALKLFTWSQKSDATLRITNIERVNNATVISGIFEERVIVIRIPFIDAASIENAIHCWCLMLLFKIEDTLISERMEKLHSVAMRLELLHGMDNCTIINDTYNSDLTSLQIALDFLEQQKQHPRRTVILSDMLQIGKPDGDLYQEVAELISQKSIYRIICIGPALTKHKAAFRKHKKIRSIFFKSTDEFLKKLHMLTFENEAILLKGARTFRFEKIEKLLEQKIHKTVLEINLSAIQHNLNTYRNLLPSGVKTMAMVKAYSYGSGSYEIANLLQYAGVDYLTVAYVDEGVALRKAGITAPIMVMSPESGAFDRMISWKLEPEIFSIDSLRQFTEIANTLNTTQYPIHIKLDTGMHRLGFMEHEITELITAIESNPAAKIVSIFSHLAGSDAADLDGFTKEQAQSFSSMSNRLMTSLSYKPLLHLVNSSGITRHPELYFDMVRLGIGMYGFDGSDKIQHKLQQIGTLKTTIAQIKELPAGETVGYSRNGKINRNSRIATVSIGYADGYFRDFGNGNAHMLIHGKPAKVLGSVCMDMCMLDITDIDNVKVGDEVIVFGNELPVSQLATWARTIPYEILTSISQRVNRVYVNE